MTREEDEQAFELCPEMLQHFSFRDDVPLENSEGLQRHGRDVLAIVGEAVQSLNNLSALVPAVSLSPNCCSHTSHRLLLPLCLGGASKLPSFPPSHTGQWTGCTSRLLPITVGAADAVRCCCSAVEDSFGRWWRGTCSTGCSSGTWRWSVERC